MYSSGWSARPSVSPASANENATQQFWLRTSQVRVPSGAHVVGLELQELEVLRRRHAPAARRSARAAASCERRSRSSYGIGHPRSSPGWWARIGPMSDTVTPAGEAALHGDARRHVEGPLLPGRRPAGRPGAAGDASCSDHGLARRPPDRRHGRRPPAHQQGRRGRARRSRPDADVDYLFLQVVVDQPIVTDQQNCGNLLAGVGPFAIERGLVPTPRRWRGARCGSTWSTPVASRSPRSRVRDGDGRRGGRHARSPVCPAPPPPIRLDFVGHRRRRRAARCCRRATPST